MQKVKIWIPAVLALVLVACGGSEKEQKGDDLMDMVDDAQNAMEVVKNADKIAEKMESAKVTADQKRKERIERGDTVAIPYKDLQGYLPEIEGYEPSGEPKGESMTMQGLSFSQCSQRYTNGESTLNISIADYNAAYNLYNMALAPYSTGITIENDSRLVKSIETDNELISGVQVFKKDSKQASLIIGVGYRFFINIEADYQEDMSFVKQVMEDMDVEKLSKM